mgnify:CR=1 FL=1
MNMKDGRRRQAAPVTLFAFQLQPARAGAPPRRVDDPVGDFAVAFAIELQILAAAGCSRSSRATPIERRVNRRLDRRRVVRLARRLRESGPPTVVPTPTTNTGTSLVAAIFSARATLAAPRLSVGDEHERLRVRRLAVQLGVFLDRAACPTRCRARCWCPTSCRPRGGTATPARGDRGRRRYVFGSRVSRTCGAAMCANSAIAMRSSFHASDSPSDTQEPHRPAPAIAGHVRRPHRRGAVLQDDEIDYRPSAPARRRRSAARARAS